MHYPGDAGTPTTDLLTVKLLLNSIISTPNEKFMIMDIKDFYLNTPMARYEYMRLRLADMPEDVIAHYKLDAIVTPDGYIYCEIQKGMYGLPQAGIIAGLTIKWDYARQKVHLSMPGYVRKALTRFQHTPPAKRQDQPYPHQTKLWSKKAILTRERPFTSAQQGGEKIHPECVWSFPVPCKSGRWGTTPHSQLSRVPTSEPNRENNGAIQAVFGLHVMPGRSSTHLSSERHGSRNPQQCVVPLRAQIPQPRRRPHVHSGK